MSRHRAIAEQIMAEYAGQLPVAWCVGSLRIANAPEGGLIIRGSDDAGDWLDNARAFPSLGIGDSWRLYHGGFLDDARLVYGYAKASRPRWIAGHSRGAAIAAIVGASLGIETVTFAQPRPLWLSPDLPDADRWVTSYCKTDDLVCYLPPRWLGWRHIGRVCWAAPRYHHVGQDHSMRHYYDGLVDGIWN